MGFKKNCYTNTNCNPTVNSCNPTNYFCNYPNLSCTNVNGPIYTHILDFNNVLNLSQSGINGNGSVLSLNRNLKPDVPTEEQDISFYTSNVNIYINGTPGSTMVSSFITNIQNTTFDGSIAIPYGSPNNFLGTELPIYRVNNGSGSEGLTTSGAVLVRTKENYSFNNIFRIMVVTVDTLTVATCNDTEDVSVCRSKNSIVKTYYADYCCDDINTEYRPTSSTTPPVEIVSNPVSSFILLLSQQLASTVPTNLKYKVATIKRSYYNYGQNQTDVPTINENMDSYLNRLINSDLNLNLSISNQAVNW